MKNLSGDNRNLETAEWHAKISLAASGAQRATLSSPKLRVAARRQGWCEQVRAYQEAGGGRANASAAQPLKKK